MTDRILGTLAWLYVTIRFTCWVLAVLGAVYLLVSGVIQLVGGLINWNGSDIGIAIVKLAALFGACNLFWMVFENYLSADRDRTILTESLEEERRVQQHARDRRS